MIISREAFNKDEQAKRKISAEVMRQSATQPPGTSDEAILDAAAAELGITVDLVAEAIGRKEHAQ